MLTERELELDNVLAGLAESLDIPPGKHRQAVERYETVGRWLEDGQYDGCSSLPEIGPQGSFRLGTVVRPIRDGKEAAYDIDLVSKLPVSVSATPPEALKAAIGDRLKEHAEYRRMLDKEGRRCWTLEYAEQDGVGFHIDILPAVPDAEQSRRLLVTSGIPWQYAQHALAVTEKDRRLGTYGWKDGGTNPRGYAEWFDNVNHAMFTKVAGIQKRLLVERQPAIYCSIDEVPDALVRTALQRAIQILKRHRDIRFLGHRWEQYKPISIILTTLAAKAYQNEGDVYSALRNILERLEVYTRLLSPTVVMTEDLASSIIQKRNGRWYIPNPVNDGENFADRWNEAGSHGAEAFFLWLSWVRADLRTALDLRDLRETRTFVEPLLGRSGTDAGVPEKAVTPVRSVYPSVVISQPSRPWGSRGGR